MKHDMKVTFFLILLFFTAQTVGLFLLNQSIESINTGENGTIEVKYSEPITGRPDIKDEASFSYILFMIFIGTALLLLLIKFRLFKVWKIWFFLAVWGALAISFSVIIPETIALILGIILAYLKLFRPNIFIHNLTEVFMYGGIAIMISPLFTVFWGTMLLIAISVYDAIAVWKLKHMITLATAQAEEKMFAGLLIPYKKQDEHTDELKIKEKKPIKSEIKISIPKGLKEEGVKSAILGGGDIAFPLIFAGTIMTWLIQTGVTKELAFLQSLIITFFSGVALFLLLVKGKKDKFYPAMPFITAGCLIGYGIVYLIQLL